MKNNRLKRILLGGLSLVLLASNLQQPALANVQIPVERLNIDNIYYVLGENVVTGESMISPTMTASWTNPTSWAQAPDPADVHSPDYYILKVKNRSTGEEVDLRIDEGTTNFTNQKIDIHEQMNLTAGSFYELAIQPYHYHTITGPGGTQTFELAINSGLPKKAYGITDLNLDFVSNEDSITVIWDDLGIPEFQYRIIYALGDYTTSTKQNLINNKEGEISGITSDSADVQSYYDPVSRRNKLSYTIREKIYPGQVYSVMVEPLADYFEGNLIVRNRNFPFIKSVSTNVVLSLTEEGDYIRLQWKIPASFRVGQNREEYSLVEATLKQYKDGQGSNIAIFNGDAAVIGYYKLLKPINETEYEIELTYKAVADATKPPIKPISNRVAFAPSEYLITPTKPFVPAPISKTLLDEMRRTMTLETIYSTLAEKYLVPGHTYTGNLDNLFNEKITFHLNQDTSTLNFVWGAFRRIDVDENSATYGKTITDMNIYYDLYVTDELRGLTSAIPTLDNVRFGSTSNDVLIKNQEGTVLGYKFNVAYFYNATSGELENIVPNQVYYIKVVAKKQTAQGVLVSEPTIVSVYYNYDGDIFAPPTIAKPPLEVKEDATTTTSVTIQWKEKWHEIISPTAVSPNLLTNWQHQIWVSPTGDLYDKATANTQYFAIYKGQTEIDKFTTYMTTIGQPITIAKRAVDLGRDSFGLSDVKYKFIRMPYQSVLDAIAAVKLTDPTYNFSKYYADMIEKDKNGEAELFWQTIVPTQDEEVLDLLNFTERNLTPNTSYLFMLYPYRELFNGETIEAHYPTPIIVSTNPEAIVIIPDPTVPNLYIDNTTDTSVTVTWQYNRDFSYEIRYSLTENFADSKVAPFSVSTNPTSPQYPENGKYYEVMIDDLFPNTNYYFWIRARQTLTNKDSLWSNPVVGTTRDVDTPLPPRGVGIASYSSMKKYDYPQPVTENYAAIEWLLDLGDVPPKQGQKVIKTYTYVLEFADNPKFIDPIYVESTGGNNDIVPASVEVLEKALIKINELLTNRFYYVRVKTRLVVTGDVTGQLIVKDSLVYSPVIRIITLTDEEEYDGDPDPANQILPAEDYELIYDASSKSLVFRFRTDEEDALGSKDNGVDQRLISQLVAQNTYVYEIDMTSFNNQSVNKQTVKIPYSILQAFNQYGVDMKINGANLNVTVPHNAIKRVVDKQVSQYGVNPSIEIVIAPLDAYYVSEQMPQSAIQSVATPMQVSIIVRSERMDEALKFTDKALKLELKTSTRYDVYAKETALYQRDASDSWSSATGTYNRYTGRMNFNTSKIGSYGLYIQSRPMTIQNTDTSGKTTSTVARPHWSESFRQNVAKTFTLDGLGSYNAEANVRESVAIQSIFGYITGQPTIKVSEPVSSSTLKTLQASGVKKDGTSNDATMTREEAFAMFVRGYEIVNDTVITPTPEALAKVNAVATISTVYKQEMAKAATLGLISDINASRPKDALKYGEFFAIWSKALGY
jgi:hypothetical protein